MRIIVLILALLEVGLLQAVSQAQSAAKDRPPLRWGGDQEGGGPYVYPDDDDPTRAIGFEVDLAKAIGEEIGGNAQFVQGTWDQLPSMLSRGDFDIILNGYEYTPERAQRYLASFPYYIYELSLAARKNDASINTWDDLNRPSPDGSRRRIAVLSGSAADEYVTAHYGETCTIQRFDGSTEALRVLQSGQIDATVQDQPILQFYVTKKRQYPEVKLVDKPVAPGYYVIYTRPEDSALVESMNSAIRHLYENRRLREIYERYGLWNDTQLRLPEVWKDWDSALQTSTASKWRILRLRIPLLLKAATVTVALSVLSMPLAIAIGLFIALVRAWDTPALGGSPHSAPQLNRILRAFCGLYVEVVRGTPLAFQLFVVYFVLPELGVVISPFWAGVVGLAVNYSAYEAEIFRLGMQAIPKGQMEAALSLGMSRPLAVRRIILPQAVRIVIPATANDFIALFKDTAVCSVIAVEELSKEYSMGAKSTGMFIEMALLTSALYLLMSYPLSLLSRWLERRLKSEPII